MSETHKILIVDDEPANLQKLRRTFIQNYQVVEATSGAQALQLLEDGPVAAIITDQRMPGLSGVELLRRSLAVSPETVRIILTGYTEVEDLMEAINQGHVHRYITKPWDPLSLREAVRQELESWRLRRENQQLARELQEANRRLEKENYKLKQEIRVMQDAPPRLIYRSQAMEELLRLLDRVVATDSTVLIQGETGTGKELVARYIHEHSPRREQPFVPVNCGAIPQDLLESAFFGHERGAFTGATESRKGFFELANQGTLFLDEIGEAPPSLQVKLLRVLQEREVLAVGAHQARPVDVRIIASTNRNLARQVEQGQFRQDLFFRLNVFSVLVPPLRARPGDIEVLAQFFLQRFSQRLNRKVSGFQEATLRLLRRYPWPGNVRELENEVERLVLLGDPGEPIRPEMLGERIRQPQVESTSPATLKEKLAELERRLILDALQAHRHNKSQAARALGITRQTIIAKLKQYRNLES